MTPKENSTPVTHRTPQRPGQPGADGEHSKPHLTSGATQPPYPTSEPETDDEADAIHRDKARPTTAK